LLSLSLSLFRYDIYFFFFTLQKWIEEYLSNFESSSSSNSILPLTTTENQFLLEDSDWLDDILNFNETSDSTQMTATNEHISTFTISTDDEYSTSNSNQHEFEVNILRKSSDSKPESCSFVYQANDEQMILIEPKSEKVEHELSPMPNMLMRRSTTQGQIDEETLEQYQIPLTVQDITQSTTEEYNRHLARLSYLTAEQIHIVKDIRRRGKNKVKFFRHQLICF